MYLQSQIKDIIIWVALTVQLPSQPSTQWCVTELSCNWTTPMHDTMPEVKNHHLWITIGSTWDRATVCVFRLLSTKLQPPGGTIVTAPSGLRSRVSVCQQTHTVSPCPGGENYLCGNFSPGRKDNISKVHGTKPRTWAKNVLL